MLVKLHFEDRDKTALFMKNFYVNDFKINNSNNESIKIRIEPDIPSPIQCHKCFVIGHTKEKCSSMPKCGHCADTNHKTEECDCQESGLKCSLCGCNHSSLDQRCKKYRAANLAVEKITKIKTGINKKNLRDISFNEPQSSKNTTTYSQIVQNPE